ncbi:MAG TPA: hypothetical protein PKZ37_17050, partial [Gallionellaceae bacterium]|nr:hypothetical protein [Gallionellaceae bacterium]
ILRSILILIITLLFLVVATGMMRSIDPNQSNIPMLAFFAILIVLLGPLWPSKEKIEKSNC